MSYLKGDSVNMGVGMEDPTHRGTFVDPQIWIPAKTPSGIIPVIAKVPIKETMATGVDSEGSEIVKKGVAGDLAVNVRSISIGYLLKSLLGSVAAPSEVESGVYKHTFTLLANNPVHPSLSLALSQPSIKDYEYTLAIISKLVLNTPVDDLVNAVASFVASKEAEHTGTFSPLFACSGGSADFLFRHQDVTIEFAATLAAMTGTGASLKEFGLTLDNKSRDNQNIGELNPGDILALLLGITATIKADYESVANYHDIFEDGSSKAMRIIIENTDVTIGAESHPKIQIDLSKVTYEGWTPDRPIEDIVTEGIELTGHFDGVTDHRAIQIELTNTQANYDNA